MNYKEHKLRILRYSIRNLWLMIFPLLRLVTILTFNPEGFRAWLEGVWVDLLVLFAIMIFGFVRWCCTNVKITDNAVIYSEGVIFHVRTEIPLENISLFTMEKPFYLLPMRAVKVNIDTRAGFFRTTDLKLLLRKKDADDLNSRIPLLTHAVRKNDISKPDFLSILIFSVFFSSGFSGAFYIAAFLVKGGDIAYDIILMSLNRITETTEKLTSGFILKIPGAAVAVGTFFLCAWILSFLVNVQRYSRFEVLSDKKVLNVVCGLFNRRSYSINFDHLNYYDLRQNLIMYFFNYVSLNINCAGYGTGSRHLPVLIPIVKEEELENRFQQFGVISSRKMKYKPRYNSWWNYTWIPLTISVSLPKLTKLAADFLPDFSELIVFSGRMLMIPSVWFVIIKIFAMLFSGVTLKDNNVIVKCCKSNSFHTVSADKDNIVKVEIMQSPFQKYLNGKCRLTFWICGEGVSKYSVRAMDLNDAAHISRLLGFRTEI